MVYLMGKDFRTIREEKSHLVRKTIPFSSERKRMTIIYDHLNDKTRFKIFTKGAPDVILDKCSHFVSSDGQNKVISQDFKK